MMLQSQKLSNKIPTKSYLPTNLFFIEVIL